MTKEQRNTTFEEYQGIIGSTVYRHRSFLKTLQMDAEDLRQELALVLLKAIEKYDPEQGAKASTYYFKMLRYGVLNLWRQQLREKRRANITTVPLTSTYDGEEVTLDLPFEVDYGMHMRIQEFLATLSARERNALVRTVSGDKPDDKRHQRFMGIVKRKALRYRLAGGIA
jgi:RNA polymerase sigma factor (sigma-70 family)